MASIDEARVELTISDEKLCYIIEKAREFDVKVAPVEPDPGSNPTDSGEAEVLGDYADDPTLAELRSVLDDLNDDELVELVALAWLGRGDFSRAEWGAAQALARDRGGHSTTDYLVGMPMVGDLLSEGLAMLGHAPEEFEAAQP